VPNADQDATDWQTWFDRYQAALMLLARQHLASPQEAQDAVQEGFIRFWQSRHRAKDRTAYLFSCVRSAAVVARRSGSSRRVREQAVASEAPQLAGPPELEDRRKLLESAMATLPAEQREVVVLKTWSALTFGQIAEILHLPANTVASRYRYAIERLKTLISSEVFHE